jgi:hypothetical protein
VAGQVSPAASRGLHVVIIIRSFGFPEGMAATNRVRLLGRALMEEGARVRVLCMRTSERPGEVRTTAPSGVADGIPYRYTPGSTMRDDRFVVRRWREARGYAAALAELSRLKRRGQLDCVFLADGGGEPWSAGLAGVRLWLRRLGVPMITELNEVPGTFDWAPARLCPALSQLSGIDGVVAISEWLSGWAAAEAQRLRRPVRVIEVPIVVDTREVSPGERAATTATFVYAASNEYLHDLAFVIRALRLVWDRFPEARLVVTGIGRRQAEAVVDQEGVRPAVDDGRITISGWVERPALIGLYREAEALLIPLHDDLRSRARFPTKLGEYLASATPVVTSRVGEVERYLRDGETAYVSEPDDLARYAAKMAEVLADPERAAAIGQAGRRMAEQRFSYQAQGTRLREFIEAISSGGALTGPTGR